MRRSLGAAAMALVVAGMAKAALEVIKSLSAIKEDPAAVKMKSEAFAAVMNSVANMMGQISSILKAMDFGSLTRRVAEATGAVPEAIEKADVPVTHWPPASAGGTAASGNAGSPPSLSLPLEGGGGAANAAQTRARLMSSLFIFFPSTLNPRSGTEPEASGRVPYTRASG